MADKKLDPLETIKEKSRFLRGTIAEGLKDPLTGAISEDDNKLLKFHGSYQQDDRDIRNDRRKKKLEPAYQFMVRVRIPGGVATPEQWLVMDELAQKYGNGTLRMTTRQTFQMHGILKWNLKQAIREMNDALMTTLAACGDVNRNVMCNPNPYQSDVHAEVYEWAKKTSDHLLPRTSAYHEIWLEDEKIIDTKEQEEAEPLYGPTYLPRKFKIGFAVPPSNDVDIFSQDLGFIAILNEGKLEGFNVAVGGGMGMTHGDPKTYPQLARIIGFCTPNQVIEVAEKVVSIQRDYGNRANRKNARFKYTIDARGLEWIKAELNERLGWDLGEARPFHFDHNGDRYGWIKGDGKWHLTLFVQSGRIKDFDGYPLMTGLREIAKIHQGEFRLTPNQNVIISNVTDEMKGKIGELVEKYHLTDGKHASALRRNSMSCVAFPTCGLAMAEAERYLPELLGKIEEILDEAGLREEEIVIRMSGCPNGCSRPALAEMAFIGKGPGKYNLYLGGSFTGDRLACLYKENIGEEEILASLRPILLQYAKERQEGEHFGDFVIRAGIVEAIRDGRDFHKPAAVNK
ncbi:MAG: assimilatory sulfite reductase (NADPH) hemoprotein subunit [Weizmannia coagulans]|jgi:sulfite reductase (NADPH) hemoprotein beta-component|uniref:assimilatory sulfite reductase (NADPH) hemoprotein subunit n=1 Tax=Heyndrickxia TaxID=2837504 RepID=UPI0007791984|nr:MULTISPECIES: assimilatory sulfite reductase (NADPH) hemoprotein subunit [Heyndrickxia]KYC79157.1 Sulfite reductase [Heyndrickxia coagulans]MCI1575674.1 assimilatory sulfite reductase (NADPH) hemoprotein subunit [Heyndrickxia coagulans]MED4313487.1 assimilatory sulfite reductase (NADPH) hemoprotein subunit [Heyndrickxia coagulans]MED4840806.1 assimilatory sulfite reductase (NADPH) hemoprotein subunit [Weizmannia sp. CD-2023]MED4901406.1 assimilatory sulfite reductase (NADPH) hemoprotein sub